MPSDLKEQVEKQKDEIKNLSCHDIPQIKDEISSIRETQEEVIEATKVLLETMRKICKEIETKNVDIVSLEELKRRLI